MRIETQRGQLAFDMCRCTDVLCEQKNRCARYIYRNQGGERTPFVATFKQDGKCDMQIVDKITSR